MLFKIMAAERKLRSNSQHQIASAILSLDQMKPLSKFIYLIVIELSHLFNLSIGITGTVAARLLSFSEGFYMGTLPYQKFSRLFKADALMAKQSRTEQNIHQIEHSHITNESHPYCRMMQSIKYNASVIQLVGRACETHSYDIFIFFLCLFSLIFFFLFVLLLSGFTFF